MPTAATALLNRLLARGKFRHLQMLLRVAELGSLQRAAEAIGVTQSSVTQTLAYLESLLEARLFERHARGVTPTPTCVDLLPVARQLLMGLAEGADMLHARQVRGGGIVRLLASGTAVQRVLRPVLPDFHARHPAVQVHLREAEGEDQLLALARGEVDLVVCRQPVAVPDGWDFTPLQPDALVVVCAPDHPLRNLRTPSPSRPARAARPSPGPTWPQLGREPWLLAPAETAARQAFDALVPKFGAPPLAHPLVTRVFAAMAPLIAGSRALALLPHGLVAPEVAAGRLALLPTPEPLPLRPLGLMAPWPPEQAGGRALHPAAGLLADALRAAAAEPFVAPGAVPPHSRS